MLVWIIAISDYCACVCMNHISDYQMIVLCRARSPEGMDVVWMFRLPVAPSSFVYFGADGIGGVMLLEN